MNLNMLFNAAEWAVAYTKDPGALRSYLWEVERQEGKRARQQVIAVAFLIAWRAANWRARASLKALAKREGLNLPGGEP
jgi:hypothetical protein